jgi:hypothetical protein
MTLLATPVPAARAQQPAAQAAPPAESQLLQATDELVDATARLRGLQPKGPIKKGVKSREEITNYMTRKIDEEYSPERLRQEGRMLKRLGLLPENIDYRQLVVNLLTEQVQGLYDPEERVLFIASWLPMFDQDSVMVHEITHALQDQHFDLRAIFRANRASDNDDRTLAQQALFEGDGTVTALQYVIAPLKRHFSDLPDLAGVQELQMEMMQSQSPVLASMPQFLKATLVFPYGYGASFLQQVWKHDPSWAAVDKIYADLPASTEQIIHPEKYYAVRDDPKPVDASLSAAKLGDGWNIPYKTVLGEFMLRQLLGLHFGEERAKRAAAGWGGDQLLLLENGAGKTAIWLETEWDTAEDAEKFYAAMEEWLRLHRPKAERNATGADSFTLAHDGELDALLKSGTGVRVVIGIPEADAKAMQ